MAIFFLVLVFFGFVVQRMLWQFSNLKFVRLVGVLFESLWSLFMISVEEVVAKVVKGLFGVNS